MVATASERGVEQASARVPRVEVLDRRTAQALPLVAGALLAPQLLLGLAQIAFGGWSSHAVLVRAGSCSGEAVRAGAWWVLLTAGWLHAGFGHFASNAFATVLFWPYVAAALGRARTLALFLVASAAGFALVAWLDPGEDGVGASGGVFGLLGAIVALALHGGERLPRAQRVVLGLLGGTYLAWTLVTSLAPGVSLTGHLGGLAAGLVLVGTGLATRGLPALDDRGAGAEGAASRRAGSLVAGALLALTVVAFAIAWRQGRPWTVRWPPAAVTVALAGTPLAFDVPATLAEHRGSELRAREAQFWFGSTRTDDVQVSVTVYPRDDGERPAAEWLATWRERAERVGPAEHLRWLAPPALVAREGRTFVYLDQADAEERGERRPRFIGVAGAQAFDLQVTVEPDAAPAWRAWAERAPLAIRARAARQ